MRQAHPRRQAPASSGFTLLELLVVLLMVTVLMAIGAPVWLSMADGQRLGAVQDTTFQALRLAQAKARQQKRIWEACFRVDTANSRVVQYSVHPAKGDKCGNANWQPLGAEAATFTTIDT
ncbi:MAG TPA: prepilin-type N-terminal cleavage/methylation domain-containing protein, partial [Coleofasciculaceae cyanobacterium]